MTLIAPAVQRFFAVRLTAQMDASPKTVESYRDAVRLLLGFAADRAGKAPSLLDFADVDHQCVTEFLAHLADARGNSPSTCNARLAAVRSLFAASALYHPEHADDVARVLAIPARKTPKPDICFLRPDEAAALEAAPDASTKAGRRDRAMWATGVQTGLRVSEITALTRGDLTMTGPNRFLTVVGKGRKQRSVPFTARTVDTLNRWLREGGQAPTSPVFPNRSGGRLSRDSVEARLKLAVEAAARVAPSLKTKHVTCHVLRHTCAMNLVHAGVDCAVISLWLGHESMESTKAYLHADLALKQRALDRLPSAAAIPADPYLPDDPLMAFLQSL
jgi:site-specific recombinase XerD